MIPKVFSISHYLRKRAKRICAEKGHAVLYRNHIRPGSKTCTRRGEVVE